MIARPMMATRSPMFGGGSMMFGGGSQQHTFMFPGGDECKADADRLCSGVIKSCTGDHCTTQCLSDHAPKLSDKCAKAHPCFADLDEKCPDMDPGQNQAIKCLKSSIDKVSDACKKTHPCLLKKEVTCEDMVYTNNTMNMGAFGGIGSMDHFAQRMMQDIGNMMNPFVNGAQAGPMSRGEQLSATEKAEKKEALDRRQRALAFDKMRFKEEKAKLEADRERLKSKDASLTQKEMDLKKRLQGRGSITISTSLLNKQSDAFAILRPSAFVCGIVLALLATPFRFF